MQSRKTTLDRFLYALGIQHVGESTAKALSTWFGDIALIRHLPWPILKLVPDIGGEVARAIDAFFQQEGNQRVIDDLLKRGVDDHRRACAIGEAAAIAGACERARRARNSEADRETRRAGRGRLRFDCGAAQGESAGARRNGIAAGHRRIAACVPRIRRGQGARAALREGGRAAFEGDRKARRTRRPDRSTARRSC